MTGFTYQPGEGGTVFTIEADGRKLAVHRWAIKAPAALRPGVDLLLRMEANGYALQDDAEMLADNDAVAALGADDAALLSLPGLSDATIELQSDGPFVRLETRIALAWKRPSGQRISGAERTGAFLRVGGVWQRLDETRLAIARAVAAYNASAGSEDRLAALAPLTECLPGGIGRGIANTPGILGAMTITVADAFSLDLEGDGANARLVPILYTTDKAGEEPLLGDHQAAFWRKHFNSFSSVRSAYALDGKAYVVLTPPLREALGVVRRMQSQSLAAKRALLAEPRAYIARALNKNSDDEAAERIFVETRAFSERVTGLGLWQPRVLPWIKLPANIWFDDSQLPPANAHPKRMEAGLRVGDRTLPLSIAEIAPLRQDIEAAIGAGEANITVIAPDGPLRVPATLETLAAIAELQSGLQPAPPDAGSRPDAETLLIKANEDALDIESDFVRRAQLETDATMLLRTTLKPHQLAGVDWLVAAWNSGRPGVLLADDMGLGKTIQTLAFLALLRRAMTEARVPRAPLLIVAPTGLLRNWQEEHDRHLASPGLGRAVAAYGPGLAALARTGDAGEPLLATEELAGADWVLTTYETLRNFSTSFGRVCFGAMCLDEAQKIKNPGVRVTDAVKGQNAGFRVALTGTPIENRLSDLWCIIDAVDYGRLDSLREFSARYETQDTEARCADLKTRLEERTGSAPPLMLRRLRSDHLPELPPCTTELTAVVMPEPQLTAYLAAVDAARAGTARGGMLGVLQALRAISLHPDLTCHCDDDAFIAASARLMAVFRRLDAIAARGERALLFIESREMQARIAAVIQRRYGLRVPPMIINGAVAGAARQDRVNRFQAIVEGFAVIILAPKAAGVGYTVTAATHVLHLERWWNPAVEDQATGRAHRIGQTRAVSVFLPIAELPAQKGGYDHVLNDLLERKRQRMRSVLCPPELDEAEQVKLYQETIGG